MTTEGAEALRIAEAELVETTRTAQATQAAEVAETTRTAEVAENEAVGATRKKAIATAAAKEDEVAASAKRLSRYDR